MRHGDRRKHRVAVGRLIVVAVVCSLGTTGARAAAPTTSVDRRTTLVVGELRRCVSAVTRVRQLVDLNAPDAEVSRAAVRTKRLCDARGEAIGLTSTTGFTRPALRARAAIGDWERGLDRLARLTDRSKAQDPADATKLVAYWRAARTGSLRAVVEINAVRKHHALAPLEQLVIAVIAG